MRSIRQRENARQADLNRAEVASTAAGSAMRWKRNVAQRGDALALLRSLPNKTHPHAKPAGLIARLIGAVTWPGDFVVDPAAGSFVVMRVANQMGRDFVGCDIACRPPQPDGGPYLELFARETKPGWDSWGDQVGLFDHGGRP